MQFQSGAALPLLPEMRKAAYPLVTQPLTVSSGDSSAASDVYVWINARSQDLTFLGCSGAFAMLSGPALTAGGLAQWLGNDQVEVFIRWLHSDTSDSTVVLQHPLSGCAFTTTCQRSLKLKPPDFTGHVDCESLDARCVVFTDIMFMPKRKHVKTFARRERQEQSAKLRKKTSSLPAGVQQPAVCIDITSSGLQILECPAEFSELLGGLQKGQDLLDFISEPQEFVYWMQKSASGGRASEYRVELRKERLVVRARCTLQMGPLHTEELESNTPISAWLCLRDMRVQDPGDADVAESFSTAKTGKTSL